MEEEKESAVEMSGKKTNKKSKRRKGEEPQMQMNLAN